MSGNFRDAAMVEPGHSEGEDERPRSYRKCCLWSSRKVGAYKRSMAPPMGSWECRTLDESPTTSSTLKM